MSICTGKLTSWKAGAISASCQSPLGSSSKSKAPTQGSPSAGSPSAVVTSVVRSAPWAELSRISIDSKALG